MQQEAQSNDEPFELGRRLLTLADCVGLGVLAYPMFTFGVFGLAFGRSAGLWCMTLVAWGVIEILRALVGFRRTSQSVRASIRRTVCGALCALTLVYTIDYGENSPGQYASWHWYLTGLIPLIGSLAYHVAKAKRLESDE